MLLNTYLRGDPLAVKSDNLYAERHRRQFAARLAELLRDKGWTQAEAGKRFGVTQGTVSDYLKGALPNGDILIIMSRELNTTIDWLLTGRGNRRGGVAPAGQHYQDGQLGMIARVRLFADELEAEVKGEARAEVGRELLQHERDLEARAPTAPDQRKRA